MEGKQRYNGFTNYETWAVSLWIGNDYASYRRYRQLAQDVSSGAQPTAVYTRREVAVRELAETLREEMCEACPVLKQSSVYADLMQAALDEVDWRELADEMLYDLADGETP